MGLVEVTPNARRETERAAEFPRPVGTSSVVRSRLVIAKVDNDLHRTGRKTAFPRVRRIEAVVLPEHLHEIRERRPGYVGSTHHMIRTAILRENYQSPTPRIGEDISEDVVGAGTGRVTTLCSTIHKQNSVAHRCPAARRASRFGAAGRESRPDPPGEFRSGTYGSRRSCWPCRGR